MTFNSLPAYEEPGDIASTGDLAIDMGYDPQRHWEAGDRPADVFVLGDFQSSLGTQNLNLDQISQVTGSDLSQMKISEVPFLQGRSVAEVAEATPALKDFTMEEIPALDGLGLDSSMTLGEAMEMDPSIGEMDFSAIAGDSAVTDVPNLDLASMESFEDWQATAISEVPGLGDIPMGSMPNGLGILSGVWGKFDMPYGPKEHTKTPTKYSITGSNKDGFTVQCVQSRGCAHIELEGFFQMHGAQWISGGTGPGQQMVNGGEGILGATNGGKEPTGRHPYGDQFKVVLSKVVESEGSAEFSLYFKYCYRGIPDLGCTPYFLGPVPMPVLDAKEKGLIITGILDGQGGLTSGLEAPESWSKKSPDPPKEVTDIVDRYTSSYGSISGGSLCGNGPGGVSYEALAKAYKTIESNIDDYDSIGIYVNGGKGGYGQTLRGRGLGKYQYMSYREEVRSIIIPKPGGLDFLEKADRGDELSVADLRRLFPPEEQDTLFKADQEGLLKKAIAEGYEGDALIARVGELHTGGRGARPGSHQVYSRRLSSAYREKLKDSDCGKATGKFINPNPGSTLTSHFDPNRFHPILGYHRPHNGTDLAKGTGTPILATDGGKVIFAGWGGGFGNLVEIDHGGGTRSKYAHLSKILVKAGTPVKQGDVIAEEGSTGISSGPHLHFELTIRGQRVDPAKYIPL